MVKERETEGWVGCFRDSMGAEDVGRGQLGVQNGSSMVVRSETLSLSLFCLSRTLMMF